MLRACGISINKSYTEVEGRVLFPPQVVYSVTSYLLFKIITIIFILTSYSS